MGDTYDFNENDAAVDVEAEGSGEALIDYPIVVEQLNKIVEALKRQLERAEGEVSRLAAMLKRESQQVTTLSTANDVIIERYTKYKDMLRANGIDPKTGEYQRRKVSEDMLAVDIMGMIIKQDNESQRFGYSDEALKAVENAIER